MGKITDFGKGIIIGLCIGVIVVGLMAGLISRHRRDKELIEYANKQLEIETLRGFYYQRDPVELIDDIPGVRGAVNGAAADFERRRDEAVQRFRSGLSSRARLVD